MNLSLGEDVVWDLTHFYRDINDENISKDIEIIKNEISVFSSRHRGKVRHLKPPDLVDCLVQLEAISGKIARIGSFAFLNFSTQTGNAKAGAFLQSFQETASQFQKDLLFFNLEWAELEDKTAALLLDDPAVEKYRHYLKQIRKYHPHHLSEVEEKLLAEISPTGVDSWNTLFDKILSQMKFGENKRTEEEVLSDLYDPDRSVRLKASEEFTAGLSGQLHILTHIFNTILADKMIMDRLRHYPAWISSMNLANEIDETTLNALIKAVTGRYDIPGRYYRLKKKMLGIDELFDYDRYAPLPFFQEKTVLWNEGRELVLDAFNDFSPQMMTIARKFFDERWIHAPVMSGKRGGAFSDPTVPEVHPYVMLNYTGNYRDVQTLAHELGHGVHQYLAGRQGYFNSQTPLTMSETASVFGEMLVFRSQLEKAQSKEEKLGLLCNKLEGMFATVFRQIAMNRFEDLMHNERRTGGELSQQGFGELWVKTQQEMFGTSVTLTGNYSIWWSYIPHFLQAPGYVYAYAFGELLVLSLYKQYLEDKDIFISKYLELLTSGGKESPSRLLEDFGIKLDDAGFWQEGLEIMDRMLQEAEELAG